jgi:VanZ family protein
VLIWVAVIFAGSTDLLSAEHTSRFLIPFLRWLSPQISAGAIDKIHWIIRKLGHLIEYAIFAALLWRALYGVTLSRAKGATLFVVCLACGVFAASDEFHQSFVSSRTASANDMMIDMCGAFVGLAICWAFAARKKLQTI